MKRIQPLRWIGAGLAIVAGTALADNTGAVSPQYARDPECHPFQSVPTDSRSELLPWAQKLSLAACQYKVAVAPVSDAESLHALVANLEQNAAPAIATYRDAMANGPAEVKILAAYDLGMMYVTVAVRARSAIRVPTAYGGAAYAGAAYFQELQRLHRALEPLLASDLESARGAFADVVQLADKYPAAARANDVMTHAVADAHAQAALLH